MMMMIRGCKSSTYSFGLALEAIVALFTASESTSLFFEIGETDGWQGRCGMVFGFIFVDLMDGNCGVNDLRLDSLFLDDWLDGLKQEKC